MGCRFSIEPSFHVKLNMWNENETRENLDSMPNWNGNETRQNLDSMPHWNGNETRELDDVQC